MQILHIKMEVCIHILKANIYMQKSNWSKEEKVKFWKNMELEASKSQQVILPIHILMKDIKGYPSITTNSYLP